jgi:hypothetical protein
VRRIALLALLSLAAAPAAAQIINVPLGSLAKEPAYFVSTTVGLLAIQSVFDGRTQSSWDFSQSAEFGVSLEKAQGRGAAFGIGATYSKVPLRYIDTTSVNSGVTCCDAHVDVITAGVQYSGGGGAGFHQLVLINVGVIVFQHFDVKDSRPLALRARPPTRDIDPRLAVGYGFGYGFSARSEAFILQEYGVSLHQGEGLASNVRRQYQQQTTRIGFRIGAGSR